MNAANTREPRSGLSEPSSPRALFMAFNALALQGFGGVLPVAQRELVERRNWLTKDEFVEMLAISQVLPGPNVVNLALMFGDRAFGWRGAMAALGGMLRDAGVEVKVDPETYPNGRFARTHDPEGNPIELWEPKKK